MTLSGREVADLLARAQHRPRRSLGQHFVVDPNTVRRIARLSGVGPGDRVVEIGAGVGSLTLALLETGAEVTAVEIDRRLVPILRQVVEPGGARVVEGDAMALDWAALLGAHRWALVANLPYNVATPLVADVLDQVPAVTRLVVLVQREVGQRLAAGVGDPAYGAVSVKVAYWARARVVAKVPPAVFLPEPAVASALVAIERRPAPAVDPAQVAPEELFRLVRAGFAQRRKMLRRSLAGLVDSGAFARAGVRPEARAEELDVVAWGTLAAATRVAGAP
ncbi:MAG TPA: 16S rRNA (adenine(1518)-N(6)/adenine(1519)-N(6))-dimethyltransferase RsmA [Acidimicrobiales bacterium]|nr:16S rRNA (adenine(1518)-N(6)/adenine(1519)-N(6))-dimethyltransferase RsmA [Acidimicrobiales bacterium]